LLYTCSRLRRARYRRCSASRDVCSRWIVV
jgi:hypothetical protein